MLGETMPSVTKDMDIYSYRLPLGVCAGIAPFNFPAMIPLWMFPMAMVCGNTYLLKPSERVPACAMLLVKMLQDSGAPDGSLNVIHGQHDGKNLSLLPWADDCWNTLFTVPVTTFYYASALTKAAARDVKFFGYPSHSFEHGFSRCVYSRFWWPKVGYLKLTHNYNCIICHSGEFHLWPSCHQGHQLCGLKSSWGVYLR